MANVFPKQVKKEIIDSWGSAVEGTWKAALLTSAYIGQYDHTSHDDYADVMAWELVGDGYTAEGATVTRYTWGAGATGYVDTTDAALDAVDVTWTVATFVNVRFVVVYYTATDKIRFIFDLDDTYSCTAATFTVVWNAAGLIKITS